MTPTKACPFRSQQPSVSCTVCPCDFGSLQLPGCHRLPWAWAGAKPFLHCVPWGLVSAPPPELLKVLAPTSPFPASLLLPHSVTALDSSLWSPPAPNLSKHVGECGRLRTAADTAFMSTYCMPGSRLLTTILPGGQCKLHCTCACKRSREFKQLAQAHTDTALTLAPAPLIPSLFSCQSLL